MTRQQQQRIPVAELCGLRELQAGLAHIFRSEASLQWEIRMHRDEYQRAGALYQFGRRLMFHRPTFEQTALRIARQKVAA